MKIAVLEPLGIPTSLLRSKLRAAIGDDVELTLYEDRDESEDSLIKRSLENDVVVLSNIQFRESVLSKLPDLKMICVAFTGCDHIDLEYCKKNNIEVCNCAGYSTVAVADLVFAMVLSLSRNLIKCDEATRDGKTKNGLVGFELENKKFGVVGLGAIGKRVAKIAQAFGCEVYATSRTKKDIDGIKFTTLDEVLKNCDIVSLHVPQNSDTINMIGERELKLMKRSAILINCARGPVVDTHALVEALNSGEISGAGIDVFDKEPPLSKDAEILKANNTLLTPHVAFASTQAFEKRADIIANNLKMYLKNEMINKVI